jgi:triacylglycerol lipase
VYYPTGFDRRKAIQLAELVGQAYGQFDAFKKNEPWSLHGDYSLVAELKYSGTRGPAHGDVTASFENELRQAARTRPRGGDGLPIGFIACSRSAVFLIFRGTMTTTEWVRDFTIRLTAYPYGAFGRVHDGFIQTYDAFRTSIHDGLGRAGRRGRLFIAGHSLGGALATLAASDLAPARGFPEATVYTFASPRVGDRVFAEAYNRMFTDRSFRIANTCDLIASMPFPVPFLGFLGGYFTHVETPVEFTRQEEDVERNHLLATYLGALRADAARKGLLRSLFGSREPPVGR